MASKLINKWRNPIRESMLHSLSESSLQVAAREEIIHYFELAQGQLFASDTRLIKMLTVRQEELARTSDESDYGAGKRTCRREERERERREKGREIHPREIANDKITLGQVLLRVALPQKKERRKTSPPPGHYTIH